MKIIHHPDQKTVELILLTLLQEILKDRKIEDEEKQAFDKLASHFHYPKENFEQLCNKVQTSDFAHQEGAMQPEVFLKKLWKEILALLDPWEAERLIRELATLVSANPDRIDEFLPHTKKEWQDHWASEKITNSLDPLERIIPDSQDEPCFTNIKNLIQAGKLSLALEEWEKHNFHQEGLKFLLRSRISLEMKDFVLAKSYLQVAREKGMDLHLIAIENYFLSFSAQTPQKNISQWCALRNLDPENLSIYQAEIMIHSLVHDLEIRGMSVQAMEFLSAIIKDHPELKNLRFRFEALEKSLYIDSSKTLYSRLLLFFYILFCATTLFYTFFDLSDLHSIFSYLKNPIFLPVPSFLDVFLSLFYWLTLFPMLLSSISLFYKHPKKIRNSTRFHNSWLQIHSDSTLYNLRLDEDFLFTSDWSIWNYRPLSRLIPFIPRWIHIWGYDEIRRRHCCVPLYGVVNPAILSNFQKGKASNFLILRTGVLSEVFYKIFENSIAFYATFLIFVSLSLSFLGNWPYFLKTFGYPPVLWIFVFALSISVPFLLSRYGFLICMKFSSLQTSAIKLVQPGIILLLTLFLGRHLYFFGSEGLALILVSTLIFALLLLDTPFKDDEATILHEIANNPKNSESVELQRGVKGFLFSNPRDISQKNWLYICADFIVIPRFFSGICTDFFIHNHKKSPLILKKSDHHVQLHSETQISFRGNFQELCKILEENSIDFKILDQTSPQKTEFKPLLLLIPLFFLTVLSLLNPQNSTISPAKSDASMITQIYSDLFTTENKKLMHAVTKISFAGHFEAETKTILFTQASEIILKDLEPLLKTQAFANFSIPDFLHIQNRDSLIDTLLWHLYQKKQPLQNQTLMEQFCERFHFFLSFDNNRFSFTFRVPSQTLVKRIIQSGLLPAWVDDLLLEDLISHHGELLQIFEEKKKNRDLCLKAIQTFAYPAQWFPKSLYEDQAFLFEALKRQPKVFFYLPETVKENPAFQTLYNSLPKEKIPVISLENEAF